MLDRICKNHGMSPSEVKRSLVNELRDGGLTEESTFLKLFVGLDDGEVEKLIAKRCVECGSERCKIARDIFYMDEMISIQEYNADYLFSQYVEAPNILGVKL